MYILQGVNILDLSYTWVKDVSALGNVHTLDLSHTHVKDVSALGNNYMFFSFSVAIGSASKRFDLGRSSPPYVKQRQD